jgi:prepilin signal peptidase PulO-like enzyme (type II secretory pathway)
MTGILIAVLTGIAFAAMTWLATLYADALCSGIKPYDDGPEPIAFPRFAFPVVAGIVGLATSLHGASPLHLVIFSLVTAALAACAACDMRCGMIPDICSLGALALIAGLAIYEKNQSVAFGAVFVFLPFASAALFSRGRGMGWGDAKLAAVGGGLLGARDATLAFTLASVAAYIVARASGKTKEPIAFGPFLVGSIVIALALERFA